MVTLAYSEQLEEIAKELDFGSVNGLITDVMTTRIRSHISDFSKEIEGSNSSTRKLISRSQFTVLMAKI